MLEHVQALILRLTVDQMQQDTMKLLSTMETGLSLYQALPIMRLKRNFSYLVEGLTPTQDVIYMFRLLKICYVAYHTGLETITMHLIFQY